MEMQIICIAYKDLTSLTDFNCFSLYVLFHITLAGETTIYSNYFLTYLNRFLYTITKHIVLL